MGSKFLEAGFSYMFSYKTVFGLDLRIEGINSMLLLQLNVFSVESIDSINHTLDKLDLRVSQTVLVGDVICNTCLSTRFSTSSTGLNLELFTSCFKSIQTFSSPARKISMDRSSHTSTQVGGTGVNISIFGINCKFFARLRFNRISNSLNTPSKTCKYSLNITAHFHRNDSELIFFIDPNKEGLILVVVDTTTLRPVTFHASNLEVGVTRHKEEVIINKLLTNFLIHASQRIVFAR